MWGNYRFLVAALAISFKDPKELFEDAMHIPSLKKIILHL
jgi:hypothetical protein